MPSPGSAAQGVIDSAQPVLARIKEVARIERMRAPETIRYDGFWGERFAAGRHYLTVAVGFGPDDDPTGTIYARYVFNDNEREGQATITVAKDVLTGRWLSDFSIHEDGPATQEAILISLLLDIHPQITRDIGEGWAWALIRDLADRVLACPEKAPAMEDDAAPV